MNCQICLCYQTRFYCLNCIQESRTRESKLIEEQSLILSEIEFLIKEKRIEYIRHLKHKREFLRIKIVQLKEEIEKKQKYINEEKNVKNQLLSTLKDKKSNLDSLFTHLYTLKNQQSHTLQAHQRLSLQSLSLIIDLQKKILKKTIHGAFSVFKLRKVRHRDTGKEELRLWNVSFDLTKSLSSVHREKLNSAVSYICQLLLLMSEYLRLPLLPFKIQFKGSKSTIHSPLHLLRHHHQHLVHSSSSTTNTNQNIPYHYHNLLRSIPISTTAATSRHLSTTNSSEHISNHSSTSSSYPRTLPLHLSDENEERFIVGLAMLNFNLCYVAHHLGIHISLSQVYQTLENLATTAITKHLAPPNIPFYLNWNKVARAHNVLYDVYTLKKAEDNKGPLMIHTIDGDDSDVDYIGHEEWNLVDDDF